MPYLPREKKSSVDVTVAIFATLLTTASIATTIYIVYLVIVALNKYIHG